MTADDLGTRASRRRLQCWIDSPGLVEAAVTVGNCRCWRTYRVDPRRHPGRREADGGSQESGTRTPGEAAWLGARCRTWRLTSGGPAMGWAARRGACCVAGPFPRGLAAQLDRVLVEAPQHRIAVPHRPRLVLITEIALAGHRVDGPGPGGRRCPRRIAGLRCLPQPQDEVPGPADVALSAVHADDRQRRHHRSRLGRAANAAGPVAAGHEIPQEPLNRLYRVAVRIDHQPRHDTLSRNDPAPLRQPDRGDVPLDESTRQRHASPFERVA